MPRKAKNLVGQRFGRLVVKEQCLLNNKTHYVCECDCGNAKVARCIPKSCGCLLKENGKKKDITGLIFGRLKAIELDYIDDRKSCVWRCLCECGNYTSVPVSKLTGNHTRSCGCLWTDTVTKHGLHGKSGYTKYLMSDPIRKLKRRIGTRIRETLKARRATKNGNIFDYLPYNVDDLKLHLEKLWEPWMNWENYGGRNDDPRMTWHIDHIVPQIKFNFTSMTDPAFLECWALSNLQPLEKIENCKKHTKA